MLLFSNYLLTQDEDYVWKAFVVFNCSLCVGVQMRIYLS